MTDDERAALNAERYGAKPKPPPLASEMTLRDYFAACALMGFLSDATCDVGTFDDFASASYKQADAMMAERDKR